jgi:hypothetical protein
MGKGHIFIDHISLEIFSLMTSLLETARIADLCMGSAWPFSRDEIGKRDLAVHPFSFKMI